MSLELAQKLRLTAAALGCVALKELAREFRRVNPTTAFDVEPAYKWLQGRSLPRSPQVYADWVTLLDLGRSPEWLQTCSVAAFTDAIADRRELDRESLVLAASRFGRTVPANRDGNDAYLEGSYACYSLAWSPYYASRMIRGGLVLASIPSGRRLAAYYSENLPTGLYRARGPVTLASRSVHLAPIEDRSNEPLYFTLTRPARPGSILLGLLSGVTVVAPERLPSVSRVAVIRVPAPGAVVEASNHYLEPGQSISRDLASLGMQLGDPVAVDSLLGSYLIGGGAGFDQLPSAVAGELTATFDRLWFQRPAETSV